MIHCMICRSRENNRGQRCTVLEMVAHVVAGSKPGRFAAVLQFWNGSDPCLAPLIPTLTCELWLRQKNHRTSHRSKIVKQ